MDTKRWIGPVAVVTALLLGHERPTARAADMTPEYSRAWPEPGPMAAGTSGIRPGSVYLRDVPAAEPGFESGFENTAPFDALGERPVIPGRGTGLQRRRTRGFQLDAPRPVRRTRRHPGHRPG
jgi:hypothetical protein